MKSRFTLWLAISLILVSIAIGSIQAQEPTIQQTYTTAITYQGQLKQNGAPVSGACDFQFSLWDDSTGGTQIGGTQTRGGVAVNKGLFDVLVDFGIGAFNGDARWLGIKVRCPAGSGSYTTLTPRQFLTPAPYALALPGLWTRPNSFSPSLIGGYAGNVVWDTATGGTVSGGGGPGIENIITDRFCVVGGGANNQAGDESDDVTDAWFATVGGGWENKATRDNATVGGGAENTASGTSSFVGGGFQNTASNIHATIGGGEANVANADSATVGGGNGNTASGNDAAVAGGYDNLAEGLASAVSGGWSNGALGWAATVGGGYGNAAHGFASTVAGGGLSDTENPFTGNVAFDDYGAIGGGGNNIAGSGDGDPTTARYATIAGGKDNLASGTYSAIGGGQGNQASGYDSTVGGGAYNEAIGVVSTIAGGWENTADYAASVGGGRGNQAIAPFATIAGGGPSDTEDPDTRNIVFANYGTVGGGGGNRAGEGGGDVDPFFATVAGGQDNRASAAHSTVGGGWGNEASGIGATVGGGGFLHAMINTSPNIASGAYSTIAGGAENSATGFYATVGGGLGNTATGGAATVAGGTDNLASGFRAMVPGGDDNQAQGNYSFAAGRSARGYSNGCFVWGDSTDAELPCMTPDRWIARASGGVYFYTNSGLTSGVRVSAGGGSWSSVSDRNLKENFAAVDGKDVLRRLANIPIDTWNYKSQDESIRHMGPIAQDFYAAFGVGEDDVTISTVDADGVALAGLQGAYQMLQEKDAQIASLEARVAALEAIVAQLAKK